MAHVPRSADLLVSMIADDQELLDAVKADPVATFKSVAKQATTSLPPPA